MGKNDSKERGGVEEETEESEEEEDGAYVDPTLDSGATFSLPCDRVKPMACAAGTLLLTKQTLLFIPTVPEEGEEGEGGASGDRPHVPSTIAHSASHAHALAVEKKRKEYRDGRIKPVGSVEIALATITTVEARRYQLQVCVHVCVWVKETDRQRAVVVWVLLTLVPCPPVALPEHRCGGVL